ncbi:hypothetical protein [Deinococcus sp.]|uniref:hypothetical protein n=1 Tax=Deinococcus sp. TaxID=47478 RepID=UPI002869D966|nr:hypothetical protein [Deinococcus sp.]
MRRSLPVSAALVILIGTEALVGFWAQLAPRAFYDHFPGFGVWVAGDGPYNEHLIRDVGGLHLGLTLLCVLALWAPRLVSPRAVGGATLAYGAPHLAYHLTHLASVPVRADQVSSVAGLVMAVAVSAALLWPTAAPRDPRSVP